MINVFTDTVYRAAFVVDPARYEHSLIDYLNVRVHVLCVHIIINNYFQLILLFDKMLIFNSS